MLEPVLPSSTCARCGQTHPAGWLPPTHGCPGGPDVVPADAPGGRGTELQPGDKVIGRTYPS